MGTGRADRKGKVGAASGKRIMTSPDGVKRYIKIEDIQSYIDKDEKETIQFQRMNRKDLQ